MVQPESGTSSASTEPAISDLPPVASAATILDAAREILPWMVEIRRDLHQHPELGLEEHRTASRIQQRLDELGLEHRDGLGGTGVLGWIQGDTTGRAVALRADVDALPLQDKKDVPYRSREDGKMHACGHDVHTAILLGAARILGSLTNRFGGTVKLIFQPAEETVGGAKLLIEEGVLENPRVEAIFGLHVDPSLDVGTFGLRFGQRNASSDNITLTIRGRSGHGAYPAGGIDAIVIAAQVVTALQTIVSRNIDARESAVVSFGTIRGGSQNNIMAHKVKLVGTVRCLDQKVREHVLRRIHEIAGGIAGGMGGKAEVEVAPGYDPLINDNDMVAIARDNAAALGGKEKVTTIPWANMGVEDFAYYCSHAPGAFFSLGVRNEEKGIVHPVHNRRFDVDEECMAYGAAVQVLNCLSILQPPSQRQE